MKSLLLSLTIASSLFSQLLENFLPESQPPKIEGSVNINNVEISYIDHGESISISKCPKNAQGTIVIPAEISSKPVTKIEPNAFEFCKQITSVQLPESITSIGSRSFRYCDKLEKINIPEATKEIGELAFVSSMRIKSIHIPSATKHIGYEAFNACYYLNSITVDQDNQNYSSDSQGCLYNKAQTKLIQIPGWYKGTYKLPASVRELDKEFCFLSERLTSFEVDSDNQHFSNDPQGALYSKDFTTIHKVPVPSKGTFTIPDTVKVIATRAFARSFHITKVLIPESVTEIKTEAFYSCGLTEIELPDNLISIDEGAFKSCHSLARIRLPRNLKHIKEIAFWDCRELTSIELPEGLKTMGRDLFGSCLKLQSIHIPASVEKIEGSIAFESGNLDRITISPESLHYHVDAQGVLYTKDLSILLQVPHTITGHYNISDETHTISGNSFRGCKKLSSVTIGQNVRTIEFQAFNTCTSLTAITLPKSVKEIGYSAFFNNQSLKKVVIEGDHLPVARGQTFGATDPDIQAYVSESIHKEKPTWAGIPTAPLKQTH